MWTAASVLACALSVLGRSEANMPRIELIDNAPPYKKKDKLNNKNQKYTKIDI